MSRVKEQGVSFIPLIATPSSGRPGRQSRGNTRKSFIYFIVKLLVSSPDKLFFPFRSSRIVYCSKKKVKFNLHSLLNSVHSAGKVTTDYQFPASTLMETKIPHASDLILLKG